jgi:molybdate transport system substrate-binding protein
MIQPLRRSRPPAGAAAGLRGATAGPAAWILAAWTLAGSIPAACLGSIAACGGQDRPRVTGFAAASLTLPLEELAPAFEREEGCVLRLDFASSGILRRKIEAGARGDFFLAAGPRPVDALETARLVKSGTRVELVANRLVAVAPAGSAPGPEKPEELAGSGIHRIALGDPDHVPAGRYARAALESLGLWSRLEGRLVPCADVRAALALVEAGEAEAGIVYASDAALARRIRVLFSFPEDSHPAIVYPGVVLEGAGRPDLAKRFLEMLRSPEGARVFRRHGFIPLGGAGESGEWGIRGGTGDTVQTHKESSRDG